MFLSKVPICQEFEVPKIPQVPGPGTYIRSIENKKIIGLNPRYLIKLAKVVRPRPHTIVDDTHERLGPGFYEADLRKE
jgi:hypothetical protein